MPEIIP